MLMHWYKTLCIFLISTFISANCLADGFGDKPLSSYTREEWSTKNGLPHNQVNSIAQTSEGYLWFATWEGLVRYNGQEFRSYGRRNVPQLLDNGIRSVSASENGSLIVGTSRGGVSILRGGVWSTLTTKEGLAQNEIYSAIEDRKGRLWVATESAGLTRITGSEVKQFNQSNGLPSNRLYTIYEDGSGAVWVPTSGGLARIQNDELQSFAVKDGLPEGGTFAVSQASDGTVYVATEHGVYKGKTGVFSKLTEDFPDEAVASLAVDSKDRLWIGTVNRGVLRYTSKGLEIFGRKDGLPNSRVPALFIDREGSTWVGTNAGMMRFSDTPFTMLNSTHGLADDYTRTVLQSKDGSVWIGTAQGLSHYFGGKAQTLDFGKSEAVLGLAETKQGSLWIGMYSTGLFHINNGKIVEHLTAKDGLPGNQIRAILEANDGSIWAGGALGLWHRKDGQSRKYTTKDGLPRDYILSLLQSSNGTLWIGTSNGLSFYRNGKINNIDISMFDNAQDVFSILEEKNGTMWFATDRGLLRFRNNKFAMVNSQHGLPIDTFFQIVADNYGNYWLTSNAGVLYLNRTETNAVADGKSKTLNFQLFTEPDGLASRQCNGGAGPAAIRSKDGSIWVATAKGISIVQPDELAKYQLSAPSVVIEGLRVNDKLADRDSNGNVILPSDTRKLELDYVSLSYRTPEQIRYRYRLQGFDNDWIERSHLRNAQYTNLPPGKYVFEVGAAHRGSGWGPQTAALNFEIEPRLYQRPWFIPLMVLLSAFFLYGLYRARVSALEARERELSEQVQERTQDLSRKNTELESLNKTIREQSEAFELQARTDALTGISNRRHLDEQLLECFKYCTSHQKPMSLLLIDVDHFKYVNDRFSHQSGDKVLQRIAGILRQVMPGKYSRWNGSDCIARWGGEEFAVMLPEINSQEARDKAEEIRSILEQTNFSDVAEGLKVTCSIGVVERTGLVNYEKLLVLADERLYQAKNTGRNRVAG
jgi:diguanylate cyclase (GGDEF)-like protein